MFRTAATVWVLMCAAAWAQSADSTAQVDAAAADTAAVADDVSESDAAVSGDTASAVDEQVDSSAAAAEPAEVDSTVGGLTVRSAPSGAAVIVDGMPVGSTPIKVGGLKAGKHRLTIAQEGYFTKNVTVLIRGGREQEISLELLAPSSITVLADVTGVTAVVDGDTLSAVPGAKTGLKPGVHHVAVYHKGGAVADTTLQMQSGASDTLSFTLKPSEPAAVEEAPERATPVPARILTIAAVGLFTVFAVVVLIVDAATD